MAWPKGVPKKKAIDQVSEEKSVENIKEPEQPKEEKRSFYICRVCKHSDEIHYEGRDRQCNTEGCRCTAYVK